VSNGGTEPIAADMITSLFEQFDEYLMVNNDPNRKFGKWSSDDLRRIADHKINRIDELLPWNYRTGE
jgi:hypothetical protein